MPGLLLIFGYVVWCIVETKSHSDQDPVFELNYDYSVSYCCLLVAYFLKSVMSGQIAANNDGSKT